MNATIGVMTKKINSTKQTFTGTSHSVVLKDPVSRENPVLLVTGAPMQKSNYMSWNGWYYWIDDIISETNNMYRIVAHVDPLATWKDDIKTAKGFCNFGPKSKYNEKAIDSRLTSDMLAYTTYKDVTFDKFSRSGSVVVRVLSLDGHCGLQTIIGSFANFQILLAQYASTLSNEINNISLEFEKVVGKIMGMGDATDSIVSAFWVPIDINDLADGGNATCGIGFYPLQGTWYYTTSWQGSPVIESQDVTLSLYSKTQDYPWLQFPEYTKVAVTTPGGKIDLSSATYPMLGTDSISLKVRYGMNIDGDAFLTIIDAGNDMILGSTSWNCAINLKDMIYKAPNATLNGFASGLKIGATMMSIAAAGSTANSIGTELTTSEQQNAFLQQNARSMASSIGTGISGAVAGMSVSQNSREFNAPNNITSFYLFSDTAETFCRFEVENFVPYVIFNDRYEDFCDDYGWPVLDYVSPDVNGPYQYAGMTVECDAPPASLSTINSYCNSLIYIE